MVLGCYPCIHVLGTAEKHNGHYCAEPCRPYFTQLMTVRREVDSVDYPVGFWSLSRYSLEIVFLWVFQLFVFGWFGRVNSRETVRLVL